MSKISHDAAVAELRQQMTTFNKPWYRSCSDIIERHDLKNGKCLDLCSGNCEYSQILRDDYNMEVICADYIPFHLEHAEKLGFSTLEIDLDGDWNTIEKNIGNQIGTFDIVVSLATVEHVFSPDNLMRAAHNALKPSGSLVINTPNIGFLAYRLYSALNGNRPYGEGHHVRFWDYRFLRTCLFFNGFEVVSDHRKFYSLPQEILLRAFRDRSALSGFIARLFHACFLFQYLPFCKGWATDELSLLCKKNDKSPIPFDYIKLKRIIENIKDEGKLERDVVLKRINDAKDRGWLKEHIYMTKLADREF